MRVFSSKKRSGFALRHEINVTPFVDVMLVLLIIFMVAAPMMNTGVSIDLPEGKSAPELSDTQPLTVTLDKKGQIYLGDRLLSPEQLVTSLKRLPQSTEKQLYLRADRDLPYARVVEIMVLLISGGHNKIALITEGATASQ